MKKVVLLAGALAAGMAAAPVAASAAPAVPSVQEVSTDLTAHGMKEQYHGILDTRSKALDDIKTAVAAKSGQFAGLSDAAQAEILANISDMLNYMGKLDYNMESLYNLIPASHIDDRVKDCLDTNVENFYNYVKNVDTYVHTTVSDADFQKLTQSYLDFANELDTYITYLGKYSTVKSEYDTLIGSDEFAQVNESEDVETARSTAATKINDFMNYLDTSHGGVLNSDDVPTLGGSGSTFGVDKGIYTTGDQYYYKHIDDLKNKEAAVKNSTEPKGALNVLEELVDLYHSDRADLLGEATGHTGKTFGTNSDVYNLKDLLDGYGTGDDAVTGYTDLLTVDPTADADFLTDYDGKYSTYYATEIQAAQTALTAKYNAVKDYIETFDAADATVWRDDTTPSTYHTGESDSYADEAGYKAGAVTLLAEFQEKIEDLNQLIKDAKKNVESYDDLMTAADDAQTDMNDAFQDETKIFMTDGTTPTSYWKRNKEQLNLGAYPALESEVVDGTDHVYQSFILDLQKELNTRYEADAMGTGKYGLTTADAADDIRTTIFKRFDAPLPNADDPTKVDDATYYNGEMKTTDAETNADVVLGKFLAKIEALETACEANEDDNATLHTMSAALEEHVQDMYDICVGYDDITAADFANGGRFWSSLACEDHRNYKGYPRLRRDWVGGFKQAEVNAYNAFDYTYDATGATNGVTDGAGTFLGNTTTPLDVTPGTPDLTPATMAGATAFKQGVDELIELLWNHVATVQCDTYLANVNTKMETEFANAKALDDVCRDAADVWSWTVPTDDANECKCEENDTKENPCGWCDTDAKDKLKNIRLAYNEKDADLDTAHAADATATAATAYTKHDTTNPAGTLYPQVGVAKSLVADYQSYAAQAESDIDEWYTAFETADAKHDQKLQDLKDEADQYVHEYIHEAVGNMSHDLANFEEGDLAAADIWAKNLENRTFPVYSSKDEAPTEEKLDLDLDGTPDTFAGFEAYVDAVRAADGIYTAEIQKLFDEHKWTELRKIADKAKDVHPATDYMKAVEANRTAKAALLAKVEDIRSDIEEAKNEAACEDPACKADIANMFTALEQQITNAETAVNNAFKAGDATAAKTDVDALAPAFGLVKKQIDDLNAQVRASKTAATDMNQMVVKAFDKTNGAKILEAQVEGYENFKVRNADPEAITNTEVKYFDEIETMVQDLMDMIAKDDSHEGGHVAATSTAKYLDEMSKIQKELDKLVQAIKDNEQAHKEQLQHRNELYKKYECYATDGLADAVNGIADPDFSLDTEFPEVPGYPETAVDPDGKDHTKAHTAVAEAIKALDAEIKKHYENGASNVEAAKTKIGEKETEYTNAFQHAQTNDSKFMEEYGKCTEAAKAVKYTYENWKADHFANGANKYSDEANVQVTNAYNEMVAAQKAYLADIKTDWYKNEAVEKVANNATLLNTYKEKISAYNAAVEKAQTNDQEFDKQLAAHVVKPLTAEATYTDTRVVADPVYVTLKAQLTALYPECNNVEATSKYNTIRKQIIQDWEDEKSALNGTAEAVAAYQAAAKKYNELMANLNAYGSQLVKYLQQKDAFDAAKTTIAGYDIMKPGYKDFDGNTEGAQDYNHKKDIEKAIEKISGNLDTLYGDMKTEATHVAETINDTNPTNNEVNDLNVAPAVGTLKTLIENLVKDAKKYEDACDANEAAFEPLHDNIKTVEADYAEGSAKVTALPEPAQEAFNLAVKNDLEALAELQKALEEAYMDEDAVNFTKDNTDYEDLKKEIEDMYGRAVQAGANLGDIDGVNGVTVYDSDALVDIVLYNRGYDVKGDFDFNGENDVTDVERLNNLLWYEHIEKAWAPGRVAFEGDIELTAEGNTVALALNNNAQANGIQFDITVPEGAYIQNVLGTDRVEGMRVLTACIADNTYRVLVISTLNASTINDNEGAIVTFNVCGGNEVEVSNVIATDGNSHRLNGAAVSVGTVTGIDEIASEGQTDIFGLDGIRQGTMKDGVNIVRGANGIVKKIFKK